MGSPHFLKPRGRDRERSGLGGLNGTSKKLQMISQIHLACPQIGSSSRCAALSAERPLDASKGAQVPRTEQSVHLSGSG